MSANCSLTLFFEKVVGALGRPHINRAVTLAHEARSLCLGTMTKVLTKVAFWHPNQAASLADESRKLYRGAMTKVLTKVAYWNPGLDFDAALESLPEGVDLAPLKERIKPIINGIDGIQRIEGQHRD